MLPTLPVPLPIRVAYARRTGDVYLPDYMDLDIITPNVMFEALYRHHRSVFSPAAEELQRFWDGVAKTGDPKLVNHPMLLKENWRRRAVPLMLHGDGARFTKTTGNTMVTIQWSFLLSTGFGWTKIYLIAAFPKSCRAYTQVHGADTWDIIWAYVCQGFAALFEGTHSALDPFGDEWPEGSVQRGLAGTPIADKKFFGVLWCMNPDAEFACNEWRVQHYSSNARCHWCPADLTAALNFRAVGDTAPWLPHVYAHGTDPPLPNHPVWRIPGVTRWHYPGDWMHSMDLGAVAYLHNGCVLDLTAADGPCAGANEEQRYLDLWNRMQAADRAALHALRMRRISSKHVKVMGALKAKANQCKHLAFTFMHVLRELPAADNIADTRLRIYELLVEAYIGRGALNGRLLTEGS